MKHDAKIGVTCDSTYCYNYIEVSPPFVYSDYTGENGCYDTSDETIEKLLGKEGWVVINGEHFCEDCRVP